jgi:hypothetical protein
VAGWRDAREVLWEVAVRQDLGRSGEEPEELFLMLVYISLMCIDNLGRIAKLVYRMGVLPVYRGFGFVKDSIGKPSETVWIDRLGEDFFIRQTGSAMSAHLRKACPASPEGRHKSQRSYLLFPSLNTSPRL